MAVTVAGCGKSQTADAKARDGAAKAVATTPVVKNSVRRSVDVVGTLAAVDQVTISSEAEGTVRAILADLGDRVKAGQILIELDNEKQQYTYQQQQAALARSLAQYGATDPQHLPEIEQTPDVSYVRRWARGIPAYSPGHPAVVRAVFDRLAQIPGLHLNCNAYRGVAMNDCARESRELALRIATRQ